MSIKEISRAMTALLVCLLAGLTTQIVEKSFGDGQEAQLVLAVPSCRCVLGSSVKRPVDHATARIAAVVRVAGASAPAPRWLILRTSASLPTGTIVSAAAGRAPPQIANL